MTTRLGVMRIPVDGRPVPLDPDRSEDRAPDPNEYQWIDFLRSDENWPEVVRKRYGLAIHEAHIRDSLNADHPPFFDRNEDHIMLILHGLSPTEDPEKLPTRPLTFFATDRLLITVRPDDSVSVPDTWQRLLSGRIRPPKDPTRLAIVLGLAITNRFLSLKSEQNRQIETWQQDLLDPSNPFSDWMVLIRHRSALRRLETTLEQTFDAIGEWRDECDTESDPPLSVRFNDLLEHTNRTLSHGRQLQSELDALVQMNFSAVSHRTNEVMRTLTVVTAIFLPLTLLAGIFGMNFEYMPELKWRYSYFVALAGMAVVASALFFSFRRRNWF